MFGDRVAHYLSFDQIYTNSAIMLAVGIVPEKYDLIGYPWFDGTAISQYTNINDNIRGDDLDAIATWMEDCRAIWDSHGGSEKVNLIDFMRWLIERYGEPHWFTEARIMGDYDEFFIRLDKAKGDPLGAEQNEIAETAEQRQARRYQMCIDAGLNMPDNDYARLPNGIKRIAEQDGISVQGFSKDVKLHIARLNEKKRQPVCKPSTDGYRTE